MRAAVTPAELFDEMVRQTGVSVVLAPGMVKRALADGGVSVEAARPEDYEAALPRLRARLKAYMTPEQADVRAKAIAAWLAGVRTGAPRHTPSSPTLRRDVEREPSGLKDLARRERSGEKPALVPDMSAPYELDGTDTTLHGRRWTADEQAQIEAARRARERK